MSTVVVLQPSYLPWLGLFDQMVRSDVFVFYDDVQYDKNGWRNRNRIKSTSGPAWLTVPVLHTGRHGQRIMDVEIDRKVAWARKHLATIRANYARAPHLARYLPELESVLTADMPMLVDLDLAVIELVCRWLGIERRVVRSSHLGIEGGQSERLLRICQHFGATRYVSGDAAKDYLDIPLFEQNGITVEWQAYQHPVYPQLHGEFVPYLSVLDLVLNAGPESLPYIQRKS